MKLEASKRLAADSMQTIEYSEKSRKDATALVRKLGRIKPSDVDIDEQGRMGSGYVASFVYNGDAMSSIIITQGDLTSWSLEVDIDTIGDSNIVFYVDDKDVISLWKKAKAELRRQSTQRDFKENASDDALSLVNKLQKI